MCCSRSGSSPESQSKKHSWYLPSRRSFRLATIPSGQTTDGKFSAWIRLCALYKSCCPANGLQIGRTVPSMNPKMFFNGALLLMAAANSSKAISNSQGTSTRVLVSRGLQQSPRKLSCIYLGQDTKFAYRIFPVTRRHFTTQNVKRNKRGWWTYYWESAR